MELGLQALIKDTEDRYQFMCTPFNLQQCVQGLFGHILHAVVVETDMFLNALDVVKWSI